MFVGSVVVNTVFQSHNRECHTHIMTDQTKGSDLSCHPTGTQMVVSRTAETSLPHVKPCSEGFYKLIHSEDTLNFTFQHGSQLYYSTYK